MVVDVFNWYLSSLNLERKEGEKENTETLLLSRYNKLENISPVWAINIFVDEDVIINME